MTLPGLSGGALSASLDLPEVPAVGSVVLLVVPGVISVLSVPTSLTQNYNIHTHTQTYTHTYSLASMDPSVKMCHDALSFLFNLFILKAFKAKYHTIYIHYNYMSNGEFVKS